MKLSLLTLASAAVLIGFSGGCNRSDQTQSTPESKTAPGAATGKPGMVLQVKWPVGSRYVYRMDLDQHSTNTIPQLPKPIQQDITMAMTYALSVLKEAADGKRELEMEFLANEMEVKMGQQLLLSFDSKEAPGNEAQNPGIAPFRKMIGSKVRLLLLPDGKLDQVVGLEQWVAQITAGSDPQAAQMVSQQFNQAFFSQLAEFGRGFPERPVRVGETWPFKAEFPSGAAGKIAVDATITLKGWENHEQRHCAILDSKGTVKGTAGNGAGPMGKMTIDSGKITGRGWFDPELGAMVEYVSDQSMRIKGEVATPAGAKKQAGAQFTSEIGQKVTLKLVDLGKASS